MTRIHRMVWTTCSRWLHTDDNRLTLQAHSSGRADLVEACHRRFRWRHQFYSAAAGNLTNGRRWVTRFTDRYWYSKRMALNAWHLQELRSAIRKLGSCCAKHSSAAGAASSDDDAGVVKPVAGENREWDCQLYEVLEDHGDWGYPLPAAVARTLCRRSVSAASCVLSPEIWTA